VAGNYAYVLQSEKLNIVDISNPTAPVVVGAYGETGSCWFVDIRVVGSYAYVADLDKGLVILDVSDPTAPAFVSMLSESSIIDRIEVIGTYAYLMGHYIDVVDISDPMAPSHAATGELPGGFPMATSVQGDFLYVSDVNNGLEIVDVSNPVAPTVVGNYDFVSTGYEMNTYGLDVAGSFAYVANDSFGLAVIDVSDPAVPALVTYLGQTAPGQAVSVVGGYAYTVAGFWGTYPRINAVDISNPAAPAIAGGCPLGSWTFRMVTQGDYAYVFGRNLLAIDMSNPVAPLVTDSVLIGSERLEGVAVDGSTMVVTDALLWPDQPHNPVKERRLTVLDLSNPASPTITGSITLATEYDDIAVRGNYAYLANGSILQVVNLTDRGAPVMAGSYSIDPYIPSEVEIAVYDNYVILASNSGIWIINVSDPNAPTFGNIIGTVTAQDIAISGHYAYTVNYESYFFTVLDISNPVSPVKVDSLPIAGANIAIMGNIAFVGWMNGFKGVKAVDISNPAAPVEVGSYQTGGIVGDLAVCNNNLLIADNYALVVLGAAFDYPCTTAGDVNRDGAVNIGDAILVVNYLFRGGQLPSPTTADTNGDCKINIGDAITLVNYIFRGGSAPVCSGCI